MGNLGIINPLVLSRGLRINIQKININFLLLGLKLFFKSSQIRLNSFVFHELVWASPVIIARRQPLFRLMPAILQLTFPAIDSLELLLSKPPSLLLL